MNMELPQLPQSPQNDIENDNEKPLSREECENERNEKLEEVYEKINDVVKRHRAEFHTASLDILGGFKGALEKMGK